MSIKQTYTSLILCLALIGCAESGKDQNSLHETVENTKTKFTVLDETKAMGLPFSDAAVVGNLVYTSGQIGNEPGSFDLVEGGVRAETRQTLTNIANILENAGTDLDHVIKCTVMLEDINDWPIVNEEYVKFFPNHKPARSAFATNGLALGAKLEIEAIATLK